MHVHAGSMSPITSLIAPNRDTTVKALAAVSCPPVETYVDIDAKLHMVTTPMKNESLNPLSCAAMDT